MRPEASQHGTRDDRSKNRSTRCYRRRSSRSSPTATPGEITFPTVFAEGCADFLLPPQPDHQTKRLFDRLLFGSTPRSFLGVRHQRVVDIDIGAQESPPAMCMSRCKYTH